MNWPAGSRTLTEQPEMRDREAGVWVFVGMEGDVQEAKVVRTSGSIKADQALLELAKRARFSPARIDRFPVSAWVQFPLSTGKSATAAPTKPPAPEPPNP